jgi:predicted transcriptional regulator
MENEPGSMVAAAATRVVAAYVSRHQASSTEIPEFLKRVAAALRSAGVPKAPAPKAPAVSLRRLVSANAVVCAECGRSGKTMARHLRAQHDLTSDAYRAKWGLPHDHPMVAPSYSARRSQLAREIGLGTKKKRSGRKAKR